MTESNGFELLHEQEIPELNTRARLLRHIKTGAEVLSLENEDENKVFAVNFRTPPADSTGLPHILEHSVLGGSQKYPVKEPFVELIKGSLNTFLNAFTYPDKTCYPVASQNLQDLYNLMDVYLDAVFFPRLSPQTLQQEGWHYELENQDAPLSYRGVVFNEMKGVYASPESLLARSAQQTLFPDTCYGVDSGGDPSVIPDLTYEQFKAFHEQYYHPSNAMFFFYGDDDPQERLRRIAAYLDQFEAIAVDATVELQPRFEAPRRVVERYPVSPEEATRQRGMISLNWLLPETDDPERVLAFDMLEHILVGKPASPLRKALIDSGLGEDLTPSRVGGELRQLYFSTGLKGVALDRMDEVETLILDTLRQLADEGLDPSTVEAAVNSTEFGLRENNTGSYPRGLLLMLRALVPWQHGGDPFAALSFEGPLARIKARLDAGEPLFEQLIQAHLLENPHRVTLILKPDPHLTRELDEAERARLVKIRASLDDAELQRIMVEQQALKEAQEAPDSPEALATIPGLTLADLERENKPIPCEVLEVSGVKTLYHELFTNGITYLDLGLNLHALPQPLLPYAGLFGRALLEMGTEREDFVRLSQRIDRSTGGIRPSLLTTAIQEQPGSEAWLFLRGKAMTPQVGELLAILRDILLTVQLDNQERFRQLVLEKKAGLEAGLLPMGHRVINQRMKAHFNEAEWAGEQMGNISQLFFLRELVKQVEQAWETVLGTLEEIRHTLLNRAAMMLNVTVDGEGWHTLQPQLTSFLGEMPSAPLVLAEWAATPGPQREGLTIPAQVNYVGKATNLYALGFEPHGSAMVIARYLRTAWLWERIRVQGGAYGAFSLFDPLTGIYAYLSYRDPNLLESLAAYDGTSGFLRRLELSEEELTKSIVGAIGDIDRYLLPDAKGYVSLERYLAQVSDEQRQQRREEILGTRPEDFRAFGEVLATMEASEEAVIVAMGGEEAIERANERLDPPLTRVKVL